MQHGMRLHQEASGTAPAGENGTGKQKPFIFLITILVALGALQFVVAGTLRWPAAWLYVGLTLGGTLAGYRYVSRRNPELFAARFTRHADAKSWDRIMTGAIGLISIAGPLLAAGQYRFTGDAGAAWPLRGAAAALIAGAFALSYWAMGCNRHFERNVRIQHDRNHRVVDTGPYRFVRHPSYLATSVLFLSMPVLLASTWAAPVALAGVALFVVRTALEDATLQRELPGYARYAARVRYRLLPGVW